MPLAARDALAVEDVDRRRTTPLDRRQHRRSQVAIPQTHEDEQRQLQRLGAVRADRSQPAVDAALAAGRALSTEAAFREADAWLNALPTDGRTP